MRFTVRRPASAEVSPCCHRPSGGDVACSVDVGIARARAAGDALENRLALAVFRCDVPAVGASLRRIRCWDEFQPPLDLVLESGDQQAPALAADLTVEALFLGDIGARAFASPACRAGHRPHVQVLDADGLKAARHIGRGLFHPVTAPVGVAGPQPRNGQLGSRPPIRSALRPRQAPLQPAQPLGLTIPQAGNPQQLTGGQCGRCRDAAINANDAAITRSRDGFWDSGKGDMPAPRSIQRDPVGLHRGRDGAGPPKPNPPDLRYPYLSLAAVEPFEVAWFESDLPKSFVGASLTPCWAAVGAIEIVAHCLGEVAQGLLLHGLRSGCQPLVFGAGCGQLGTLLVIARRPTAWLPVLLLLDGQIPHEPCVTTVFSQRHRLLRVRTQSKSAHANNLRTTTDILPKGGMRPLLPRLEPRGSTPQN